MKTRYILFLVLTAAFSSIQCTDSKTNTSKEPVESSEEETNIIRVTEAQFMNSDMKLGQLETRSFAETVTTNGVIDVPPQSRAVINAFAGGYVKNTPLLIGDRVRKGQRLVTLENPEFVTMQREYLETAEQLTYLKTEYERQQQLIEENITSQKSFLKSESEYKAALARYNSLKKNLQLLNINPTAVEEGTITSQVGIYSPIDGNVTQLFISTGSYVSPSDKIMEIMNTDHIHLELKVFEKDIMKLKKDQEITFTIPEASSDRYKAEVHLVGTSIDPQSRTVMVHGHPTHEEGTTFTAGMFVEASIMVGSEENPSLPEDAIVSFEGHRYVLQLKERAENGDYIFEQKQVATGENREGYFAILSDDVITSEETPILIDGAFALIQGDGGGHTH
ncbi:efflux RND transporter periplasmic adaptor subunit [Flavobacteriaceae bacterium TK19130]|nr:efflux RND transporter periplasmic adaptor subunit [Thermobacterium salinum]